MKPAVTPDGVRRRASAAWRDASMKHDQAVNAAVKANENPGRAEQREREAALTLARAEESRRLAAQ
eukprot:2103568-Pyramimonas_sp.AAC.1